MPKVADKLPATYPLLLKEIKDRIRFAQVKTALSANRELIELYWGIGKSIVARQHDEGWGKSVVEKLSKDIRKEFSGTTGYSPQNLWYMRAFYIAWTDEVQNLPQAVGEIPWGHNLQLLSKLKNPIKRIWYAQMVVEHGWSRNVLVHQIESNLYGRQGKATTNFSVSLPASQSDLAKQLLKDPYHLDFLAIGPNITERQLELALLKRL
jgi:predicted nuclease of restriction endonuclease-like (RecB) superfamily